MTKFAFYGRVSTEDQQDPESSRGWQLTRSRALVETRGGVIVTEFFDVDKSRSIPWQRRPEATALLAELKNPDRGFDAVVIGEPHRAFYGNQYGLTIPLFDHYGVQRRGLARPLDRVDRRDAQHRHQHRELEPEHLRARARQHGPGRLLDHDHQLRTAGEIHADLVLQMPALPAG